MCLYISGLRTSVIRPFLFIPKVLQSKHDSLLQRIDELDQECEELREKVMDIEGERDELRDILDETKIQSESLNKELAEKQVGFNSCNIQLSDYNFTSVTCEKNASSLTLPNPQVFHSMTSGFRLQ